MTSTAVLALITFLVGAPAPAAPVSRAVVDPYLKIQAALVKDSIDGLADNANAVATAARALGAPGEPIVTAATGLAAAKDLTEARDKFGDLSDAMESYRNAQGLVWPEGVKRAYCPMVKKYWVQEGTRIANPYFGTEMPTCGSFR